jgi:drug/metabolite transporter (DMT)-like permease
VFFAIFTAFLWAILPFVLVPLFQAVDVLHVISFRFVFSFAVVFSFLGFRYRWKWKRIFQWSLPVLAAGLLLSLNYFGFSYGLSLTTASTAQILIQSGPLIFTVLGLFVLKERLSKVQILGLALACVGFLLFYEDKIQNFLGSVANYKEGVFWIFVGGLSWGVYAIFHKIACRRHDPQQINLMIYLTGSILYVPWLSPTNLISLSTSVWLLLLFASVNTVLAYGSLSEALKRMPSTKVSLILCLNPILTMLISEIGTAFEISWLGTEVLQEMAWVGGGLVILGAILVVSGKEVAVKKSTVKDRPLKSTKRS